MKDKRPFMQKRLWILMHRVNGGTQWAASMDYAFPWSTKKSAEDKIKSLGEKGKNYRAFRFDAAPASPKH